jgi:hypothetical protein
MTIVPIREDNAYVAAGLQSAQGTPVTPSYCFRWLDGSKLEFDMKTLEVWEGDGSRHLSQLIKEHQMVKLNLKLYPRPIEVGFLESAAMGIGADTYTAASINTTVSANTTAGASTINVPVNTGLTGAGTITLVVGAGSVNEEVATFVTPVTGAGPYTLTVAASGSLKNAHSTSDVIRSYSQHVLSDQNDSAYYTFEVGLGSLNGGAGPSIRVTDCKVEEIKRHAKAGSLLEYELTVYGLASVSQGSPLTVTYENHSPFLYSQSNGGWTLNGSTTGDAAAVSSFNIDQKNNIDTSVQAEQLSLAALVFGNLSIKVTVELIMQNTNQIALTYWGSTNGTTDAQAIGAGNMTVKFTQPDGFHTLALYIPTLHYNTLKMPEPKKDGKHYKFTCNAESVSNQSANAYLLQATVQNTKNVSY